MLGFLKKHKDKKDEELEQIKESIDKDMLDQSSQGQLQQPSNASPQVPSLQQAIQQPSSDEVKQAEKAPSSNTEGPAPASEKRDVSEEAPAISSSLDSKKSALIQQPSKEADVEEFSNKGTDIDKLFDAESQEPLSSDVPEEQPSLEGFNDEDVVKEAEASVKISPPLFISVQRYKEIINELLNLKASLVSMESVVKELNKARDEEVNVLKTSIDELDNINKKIKYFVEAFKING